MSSRSSPQNRFYFGVVVPAVRMMFLEQGDMATPETVHDFLMMEIGGHKITSKLTGRAMRDGFSSTRYSTTEREDYITAVRAWAAGFGYAVPFPNEFDNWGNVSKAGADRCQPIGVVDSLKTSNDNRPQSRIVGLAGFY